MRGRAFASVMRSLMLLGLLALPASVDAAGPAPAQGPCWPTCRALYERWQTTQAARARAQADADHADQAATSARATSIADRAARAAAIARFQALRRHAEDEAARDAYLRCAERCGVEFGSAASLESLPGNVTGRIKVLANQALPLQTVGLVVPADLQPGDTFSGTVVADVDQFAEVPGLRVIPVNVSSVVAPDQTPIIESIAVRTATGDWPASLAFTSRLPGDGRPARLTFFGADALARPIPVAVRPSGEPSGVPRGAIQSPPTCIPGSLSVVFGPFDGDASTSIITIDGVRAVVLAESPRTAFWLAPASIDPGRRELVIVDGTEVPVLRSIAALRLSMTADRPDLTEGQKTSFRVSVEGLGGIPPEAWRGGFVPELTSWPAVLKVAPGLAPPQGDQPGVILLHVANTTADIITIEESRDESLVFAIDARSVPVTGTFEYRGVIRSIRTGRFGVAGSLTPLLALTGDGGRR